MLVILIGPDGGKTAVEANLVTSIEPTDSKNPADEGILHVYYLDTMVLATGELREIVALINSAKDEGNTRGV